MLLAAGLPIAEVEEAHSITAALGLAENQHFAAIHFPLQQPQQAWVLLRLCQEHEGLCNHVIGLELGGANGDLVGISQEIP